MKTSIWIFALLLIVVLPARARLGETEDQCIARYGAIVARPDEDMLGTSKGALLFIRNGYSIVVWMLDGKCAAIVFGKQDKSELSENEINLLLDADSAGQKWTKSSEPSTHFEWTRDDGATALYNILQHTLVMTTKEGGIAAEKTLDKSEAEKIQGF